MRFSVGEHLGPYEILALIGAGGMGEVWKAHDTRLDRTVALKVSGREFTARFGREARAIAQFNHPHICTLHDVGPDYLVMEYVEGRPILGPLPVDTALKYAVQILNALEAAHCKGIIHRDLKPGNILVTKNGIKLLDFGLAKFLHTSHEPAATTATLSTTRENTTIGTLLYMSPEQLRGEQADARSDLFAFGVVFYEMLTGSRPFKAASQAGVIAAILEREPVPLRSSQPTVPAALERAVDKCLAKAPERRWQTATDLRDQLEWIAADSLQAPAQTVPTSMSVWPWVLIASTLAVIAILGWLRRPGIEGGSVELSFFPPVNASFHWLQAAAISPDGQMLAFVAVSGGKSSLWVRRLDSVAVRQLPGTEGASAPFWSPDARSLAFFAERRLKKVALAGGAPQTLCAASAGRGGAWSPFGVIVFAPVINGNLFVVPDSGGAPVQLTQLDKSRQENAHYWPQFLSDGHRFIYLARSVQPDLSAIQVGSVDRAPNAQDRITLVNTMVSGAYVAPRQGGPAELLFVRHGTLFAQRLDEDRARLEGQPVPIVEGVGASAFVGLADFSASQNGVLVYGNGSSSTSRLTWRSRDGRQTSTLDAPGIYLAPRLSPDGTKLAVTRADPVTANADISIIDTSRGVGSRFTFDPAFDFHPVWSRGGKQILFSSNRFGPFNLFRKDVSGAGEEEQISKSDTTQLAEDWSPDGRFILFLERGPKTAEDLWILSLDRPQKPFPFAQTNASERNGQFSPNGRWIAYDSDETGSYHVYVRSFSGEEQPTSAKWQVSMTGGSQPRWRQDGSEIFYLGADGNLMSVEVKQTPSTFEVSSPHVLFDAGVLAMTNDFSFFYDAAADGKRFLLVATADQGRAGPLSVLTNWQSRLR